LVSLAQNMIRLRFYIRFERSKSLDRVIQ
jgi:hypothetical protein